MNYSIGKTPAIDEIVIKTLGIPVISPDINPLDTLEIVREAIMQALDKDLYPEDSSEISKYYESFPPKQLKAALRVINSRLSYADALSDYLDILYQESVGTNSSLTPHAQLESTPRFNFDEIDYHLKFYLLQGTDEDTHQTEQDTDDSLAIGKTKKQRGTTVFQATLNKMNLTGFLIADCFAKAPKYRKQNGDPNIRAISLAVQEFAKNKYPDVKGQGDSTIRDRLKRGKKALRDPDE